MTGEAATKDQLTRTTLALAMNVGITSGVGALSWVVAARYLSEGRLAQDLALVTAMAGIASIAELGGTITLPRFLPVLGARAPRAIVACYAGAGAVALLMGTVFVVVAPHVAESYAFLAGRPWVQVLFVVAVCLATVFALQDAVLVALRGATWIVVENAGFAALKLLLLVGLAVVDAPFPFFASWVIGLVVAVAVINSLVVPGRARALAVGPSSVRLPEIRRFAAHGFLTVVVAHAGTTLLPVFVFLTAGPAHGSAFAVAFTIAVALENVALGLGVALTVEGAYDAEGLAALVRRALARGMVLVVLACLVVVVAAPLLLAPFGRALVESSTTVLRLLALGTVPQALIHLYVAVARVLGRSGQVLVLQATTTVLLFGCILVLAPARALVGVGIAWVVVHAVLALVVLPGVLRAARLTSGSAAGRVDAVRDLRA